MTSYKSSWRKVVELILKPYHIGVAFYDSVDLWHTIMYVEIFIVGDEMSLHKFDFKVDESYDEIEFILRSLLFNPTDPLFSDA